VPSRHWPCSSKRPALLVSGRAQSPPRSSLGSSTSRGTFQRRGRRTESTHGEDRPETPEQSGAPGASHDVHPERDSVCIATPPPSGPTCSSRHRAARAPLGGDAAMPLTHTLPIPRWAPSHRDAGALFLRCRKSRTRGFHAWDGLAVVPRSVITTTISAGRRQLLLPVHFAPDGACEGGHRRSGAGKGCSALTCHGRRPASAPSQRGAHRWRRIGTSAAVRGRWTTGDVSFCPPPSHRRMAPDRREPEARGLSGDALARRADVGSATASCSAHPRRGWVPFRLVRGLAGRRPTSMCSGSFERGSLSSMSGVVPTDVSRETP
jgi:hypothetical protein